MSIFIEQHHNVLLFTWLSIDDIGALSQVNKYYYNITKNILEPFRTFGFTKKSLSIKIPFYNALLTAKDLEKCDHKPRIIIQAYIYGNLDVIKYITNRFEKISLGTRIIISSISEWIYIDTLLVLITLYQRRLDILLFMKDVYTFAELMLPAIITYNDYFTDYFTADVFKILDEGGFYL